MKGKSKAKLWSFWIGIVVVLGTHLYMLGLGLPQNQIVPHSIINLLAGALLVYAWY